MILKPGRGISQLNFHNLTVRISTSTMEKFSIRITGRIPEDFSRCLKLPLNIRLLLILLLTMMGFDSSSTPTNRSKPDLTHPQISNISISAPATKPSSLNPHCGYLKRYTTTVEILSKIERDNSAKPNFNCCSMSSTNYGEKEKKES